MSIHCTSMGEQTATNLFAVYGERAQLVVKIPGSTIITILSKAGPESAYKMLSPVYSKLSYSAVRTPRHTRNIQTFAHVHIHTAGADPGFSWWGGGAQKLMCAHAHYDHETQRPFRQDSKARLKALEALGLFYALSCYLRIIFNHSDAKWDLKTSGFFWGAQVAPPLNPPLCDIRTYSHRIVIINTRT